VAVFGVTMQCWAQIQKIGENIWVLGALIFLLLSRCSGTSTEQLLKLQFLQGDTYLAVETESLVNSGRSFAVTVTARKRNINALDLNFNGQLTVTASGAGTLNVSQIEPWSQGKTRITLAYTTNVGVGNIDSIVLQVAAAGSSVSGASNRITIYNEPTLHHFAVTIPATAQINTAFNVTITAKDVNGNTVASFSTPDDAGVLTTASSASGALTVTSPASGFVNGVLIVSASYNVAVYALRVRVALQSDATIKGESGPLNIQSAAQAGLANFRVMAIPVGSDRIRLNWTKIPEAFDIIVEEEQTPGSYTQIANFSGSLHFYYHTGLAAATVHSYRVTVKDSTATTLLQGTASATTFGVGGCTTPIAATTYTTNQSWTIANSPYCITGSVIFDSGARLDIERGALILMSSAGKLTFRNGATFLPAETGSGLVRISSSSTSSPPTPHLGIAFESTASATVYASGTDDYANGSVVRHLYYEYGGRIESAVDIMVDDSFFRQNLSGVVTQPAAVKTVVVNSTFQNNYASYSGAALSFSQKQALVSASTFEYNSSPSGGTAINYARITRNSFFLGNSAGGNGGAIAGGEVADSVFVKNTTSGSGGALQQITGGGNTTGISNCYFYLNQSTGHGGAAYITGRDEAIVNSYFEQNVAGLNGGAVYLEFADSAGSNQTKNLRYNWYSANAATGQGSAVFVDTRDVVNRRVLFSSIQEYYLNNATGTSALYVRQNRDATDTDNDTATILKSVFKRATSDIETAANIAFVLTGNPTPVGAVNGTISNSYFESGAADCTAAFIVGATSSCATPTPNLFKTDAAWPFCSVTAPGQATPADCVGPNWDKPIP
jgi:predicted outer membrane repeat protein